MSSKNHQGRHKIICKIPQTKKNLNDNNSEEEEEEEEDEEEKEPIKYKNSRKLRKNERLKLLKSSSWSQSVPNIAINTNITIPRRARSNTISQPIQIPNKRVVRLTAEALLQQNENKVPSFTYKQTILSGESSSSGGIISNNDLIPITLVKCDDIKIHFDQKYTANTSTSLPSTTRNNLLLQHSLQMQSKKSLFNYFDNFENGETSNCSKSPVRNTFSPIAGEKIQQRHQKPSILDDASIEPIFNKNSNEYPTKPWQGQSLTSFLQAAQFARANTDLERENAHFSISEAMISAIEQVKWNQTEKQKLRKHWESNRNSRKKFEHKLIKKWDNDDALSSETVSSNSTSNYSDLSSDDDFSKDFQVSTSLSISSHNSNTNDQTYAYAEWGGENMSEALSAESVALSLISKFSDKQLPRASDLLWLVSEQDAPQQLLPMPGSWSADNDDKFKINTFMRGTRDWAPPRAQIIFTRHPKPDRKTMLQQQNQKCCGCGMKVATAYSNRYRYCEYTGKYHCSGCHRNQISIIPARILQRWEFNLYPVSVFSYRLLEQINSYPLFRVSDLNPKLYEKIKVFRIARILRIKLKFIEDFIKTCRFATKFKTMFENIPSHLTVDVDNWALADFIAIKNGSFNKDLNAFIAKCEVHVVNCELCTARGFICELCPKKTVMFPWQNKVRRCIGCGTCYHTSCWVDDCLKCQRLRQRQERQNNSIT